MAGSGFDIDVAAVALLATLVLLWYVSQIFTADQVQHAGADKEEVGGDIYWEGMLSMTAELLWVIGKCAYLVACWLTH
jgi:hypothetical protein